MHAATLVDAVLTAGRNFDDAFRHAEFGELSDRDRAFVKALCFGTLRTHTRNALLLEQLLGKPLRRRDSVVGALLSTALHALIDSDTAPYATVSATVDATAALGKPKLRGLVNAVLRRYQREAPALLAAAQARPEGRWQHPEWFIKRLQHDWPDDWQAILTAANEQPPLWLRINARRCTRADWLARLPAGAATAGPLPQAVHVHTPVPVSELPGFAAGDCSVQDLASQFAAVLLDAQPGMRVLDACAAPGGKACHVLERAAVELVALDKSGPRLQRVRDNLQRLALAASVVAGDATEPSQWWDGRPFDRILLDAPCSATGVIRRHPDIRFLRRPADIAKFVATQRELLDALWPLLRPGGRLLYSTCSLLPAENSAVVREFLAVTANARVVDPGAAAPLNQLPFAAARALEPGLQLLPGNGDTDGFYYVLIECV